MNLKPTILIVYDYFFPGFRAGGPVQSLTNLIVALQHRYSFSVLTTAYDLMSEQPYEFVEQNLWSRVILPNMAEPINVWYAGKGKPDFGTLKILIKQADPDVIYLNGIYSFRLFLLPLLLKSYVSSAGIVVCPRGMLQSGALSVKSSKKKFYVKALQLIKLLNKVTWHATNAEEAKDIRTYFPNNRGTVIAYNIPKTPLISLTFPEKKANELKLVYLSLITEKKNLLLLLQVLALLPETIQLDIYGPIKDNEYWHQCNELIKEMPARVRYLGDIEPIKVQEKLAEYHAMCLLTRGENFGHALYETLSVGRPIITSFFTPWNDLWTSKAGVNADINTKEDCKIKIKEMASMPQQEYNSFCSGAHNIALGYFNNLHSLETYKPLFG